MFIRKGIIHREDRRKVLGFGISAVDCSVNPNITDSVVKESDEILESEQGDFEEPRVLYEWAGSGFDKLDDVDEQEWFHWTKE